MAFERILWQVPADKRAKRFAFSVLLILCVLAAAAAIYLVHGNLSTVGFIEMSLVLLSAMRFGFFQATVVSVSSFLCQNFLFTAPVFKFFVADPQNWITLFTFKGIALVVSGFAARVRIHAVESNEQRTRALKLYELSRAILPIDQRHSTSDQLRGLIREILRVDDVEIWLTLESALTLGQPTQIQQRQPNDAFDTKCATKNLVSGLTQRPIRLDANTIGALTLRGWQIDSLTADAVASLAAITFERSRAVQRESRAGAERDAERLRTAVLGCLANGFKTPLTAIQSASSGLLALRRSSASQTELASTIDEQATMLGQLTTRLLQAAALEAKEIRLRRSSVSIADLLDKVVLQQDEGTRARTTVINPQEGDDDQADKSLVEVAMRQLIDNAAKYSAVGTLIKIRLNQNYFKTAIAVQNRALGSLSIKPEERTRIFDRFYRGAEAVRGPAGNGPELFMPS